MVFVGQVKVRNGEEVTKGPLHALPCCPETTLGVCGVLRIGRGHLFQTHILCGDRSQGEGAEVHQLQHKGLHCCMRDKQ